MSEPELPLLPDEPVQPLTAAEKDLLARYDREALPLLKSIAQAFADKAGVAGGSTIHVFFNSTPWSANVLTSMIESAPSDATPRTPKADSSKA